MSVCMMPNTRGSELCYSVAQREGEKTESSLFCYVLIMCRKHVCLVLYFG